MSQVAKLFNNSRSQAVGLLAAFRFCGERGLYPPRPGYRRHHLVA